MVFNGTFNNETLLIGQKCKQYILKWDAVGSILKQAKRKHQLTIKTCIKYVDKKYPVMRPNLQPLNQNCTL
jgi:hypothetical protein